MGSGHLGESITAQEAPCGVVFIASNDESEVTIGTLGTRGTI